VRVALVSDVHGNLTALEAVIADIDRRGVDLVVHGGDLALMGPRPAEVVDRVRDLGWDGVVGNTDELLWHPDEHERQLERAPKLAPLLDIIFEAYAPDTSARLGEERIAWLRTLPPDHRGNAFTVVHARPDDLWRAPMPEATDDELSTTYSRLAAERVAYGHIHRPFVRHLDGLTVANAGSVGLPFDGDPRAAYLLFDNAVPNIIRVEYDVEEEVRALHAAGHPDADRLAQMRRTGTFVPPRPDAKQASNPA
jgi:predicted phosphodiesterase